MKINLRKASVVQQAIQDEIKRIGSGTSELGISLFDSFENVQSAMDVGYAKFESNHQLVGQLLQANKFLRGAVARKNAEIGIMEYLAEEAMLGHLEGQFKAIVDMPVRLSTISLENELAARKGALGKERNIYGRDSEYSLRVNVVPQKTVDDAKLELEKIRKRRRKIKDEMVSLNVRTDIEVPEQVALVLTQLGLD